ncbi:hypothetical protein GCM10023093_07220 [Nemorincola caseinilytica]|uniref:Type IV secretion system coupling protein TraD DNA-binding domain-containing protein n=1 Tax=Nemorincola caseinilytica TaxID=2054315 RepID=A0ABP8N8N0_9BACT
MEAWDLTLIGTTNYRNTNLKFGIKDQDRLAHIFCIGKTGVGKSTLLVNMAMSDICKGKGLAVLDPHGDAAQTLLGKIPLHRKKDLIYFAPANTSNPTAFNPLHGVSPQHHHLVASGLVSVFKKVWGEISWGPRMENILRFVFLALLEYPDATLLDIQPLLTKPNFRHEVLLKVKNEFTQAFWRDEFEKLTPSQRAEAISPILNKTSVFRTSRPLMLTVGRKERGLSMQQVMDGSKVLICNFSKGMLGEEASMIIGSMVVTFLQMSAMYRARIAESRRIPFFLYIDESQSFVTQSFADLLSEARKYGLGIFMANQFLDQLNDKIRSAILGNVGTLISFRVGSKDAEELAREFFPIFDQVDLVHLPRFSMYLKLAIDGATSQPFSADTLKQDQ